MTLHGLPDPVRDTDSAPFWEGIDAGRVLLQRCAACEAFRYPPGPCCPACGSTDAEWVTASGRGTVYSWVVAHVPFAPVLDGQLPYTVGMIDLEEGVRMVATIDACDPGTITAAMPVQAQWNTRPDGRPMLTFVPAGERDA